MSVYLYTGGLGIVKRSGVDQAILHQRKALEPVVISVGLTIARIYSHF